MAIQRITVLNYRTLGQKFIEWALNPASRPNNLADFVQQTTGILDQFPNYINDFKLVQAPDKSQLLLRLPPAELVQDTLTDIATQQGDYRLPKFYEQKFLHGQHSDKREFFEFRVGDYLIAHCS
jgi:hypothetical protein